MNSERTSRMRIARSCVMALIGAMVVPCVHVRAAEQWRLIPVEVDGITNAAVTDFVIGADGTPWVTVPGRQPAVCFWREGKWRRIDGEYSIDPHTSQLHLSPTGRVYLSQTTPHRYRRGGTPPKPHFGALYLLENTEAKYITEFYYERSHFQRPLFFDSKGRIWNWGTMFLAKYEDEQWERVEANIGWRASIIEDADGNVYCFGTTVSYWRDGRFTVNVKAPSFPREQPALKGYLWGTDKALLIASGDRGAVVLDLGTMTASDVLDSRPLPDSVMRELYAGRARGETRQTAWQNLPLMARSTFWDGFRDTEGNVWLLTHNQSSPNYFYIKVCAADNSVEERLETAAIDWGNGMGNARKPVLCARDGAIYFGASRDGVYLYRNGELTHVSWQQGLAINHTRWVCEHPDGTIWFASRRMGIAVYDPCGVPGTGPTSPFQTSWEEYPLAARPMLRDFEGHLWCFLKDHSGKISRWDGRAWEHFDLGVEAFYLSCLWADNLRRIHVVATVDRDRFVCRLERGRVEHFADVKEMLLDSVRTGAREFKSGPGYFSAPLVTSDQEIWCRHTSMARLMRYSSGVWNNIEIDPFSTSLFTHKADQVLIRSRAGFTTLDRGQLVEFTDEHTRNQEYLLSESGLQPFDKDLYEAHPREFFPARRTEDAVYVFDSLTDFHDFQEDDVPAGTAKFSQYFDRIWLAEGGFWAHSDNLCELQRCYEGLLLRVDLAVTPVAADLGANNCDAYEDANADLWIRRHETLFHVKRPKLDTRIVAPQVTEYTSPSLRIKFGGVSDGPVVEPLRYAWRLDGGPWSTPTVEEHADLEFTRPGPHEFQVLCVGRIGNIDTTPATMTFDVELPVPEVRIVSAPQDLVTDLNVAIGCEIVKQSEGSAVTCQWRLDGGPWCDTQETTIRPSPLEDGEHLFEVRAVADHKYIQAEPASVKFTVRVDYETAVALAVKDLGSADYAEREAAAKRLVSLGDKCLPHLKRELKNANEDVRWWIQAVISEMEER